MLAALRPISASRRQPLFVGAWISLVALVLLLLGLGGLPGPSLPATPARCSLDALELQIAPDPRLHRPGGLSCPPPGPPQVEPGAG